MNTNLHFLDKGPAPISQQPGAENFEIIHRAKSLIILDKKFSLTQPGSLVNVFGSYWTMIVGDHSKNWASLWVNGEWREEPGVVAGIFPPFSVAVWRFAAGHHEAKIYLSTMPMVRGLNTPHVFAVNSPLPDNQDQLRAFMGKYQPTMTAIPQPSVSRSVAMLKRQIDDTYQEQETLVRFLRQKSISYKGVARAFKRAYGISPSQYRLKLRLLEARLRILWGESVIDAAFSCGYNNLSLFNRQFRRENRVTPSRMFSK